jgi:hypothetical protein
MSAVAYFKILSQYLARGGVVGWGATLQAGRSPVIYPMRSLDFLIDLIPQAALWPWGWLSLWLSTKNLPGR